MPLISQVGRRSFTVRALFIAMYLMLSLGAVTMAYPFVLMLTMGTTGRPDYQDFRLIPRYWRSDTALFKKYLLDLIPFERSAWNASESVPVVALATWFERDDWFSTLDVRDETLAPVMSVPAETRRTMAADLRHFIEAVCPPEFKIPLGLFDPESVLSLRTDYYPWLRNRYGSLEGVNRVYVDNAVEWKELGVVAEQFNRQPGTTRREQDWREFIESRPPERTGLFDANMLIHQFVREVELPADILPERRNADGNLNLASVTYDDLETGSLGMDLREQFLRTRAPARFMSVDVSAAGEAWQRFLADREAAPDTPLSAHMPAQPAMAVLWGRFIQSDAPAGTLRLRRPEDHWRDFLRERYPDIASLNQAYAADHADFSAVKIPHALFRYDAFLREKNTLRRQYLTHNFKEVFKFVAVHGSALRVTLIYVLLMIGGTLTINPLAAYAMSRFRLKESHHVLIFLLATMAFPGEVLMIPNFLQIKSFPWMQFSVVFVCLALFFVLHRRLSRRVPFLVSLTSALGLTAGLALWVVPKLATSLGVSTSVTLMNTYWALVLPALANGYGIFLLKGFFDSLPPELYEAGLIDGASEMRMFWQITLPLCKPIMAVLALGAFTAAYGAFMHAFLICQDPRMWTFMVFLYEFQQTHTVSMVMASLVVSAIPTLLVFIFCQNIILRGIVIPTFK